MDVDEYRSCSTHCCKNHGCKYGHDSCPVATLAIEQEYLCEWCTMDLQEADVYVAGMASTNVSVGYSRDNSTITDLPSQESVDEAIKAALMNLEVAPGWTIRLVIE